MNDQFTTALEKAKASLLESMAACEAGIKKADFYSTIINQQPSGIKGRRSGGSSPLGQAEIQRREELKRSVQLLNAKSQYIRWQLKGGDAI